MGSSQETLDSGFEQRTPAIDKVPPGPGFSSIPLIPKLCYDEGATEALLIVWNRNRKAKYWDAVVDAVEIPMESCKASWIHLRSEFMRRRKLPPTGSGARKPWPFL